MPTFEIVVLRQGGSPLNRFVDHERATDLRSASPAWPSWEQTPRRACDRTEAADRILGHLHRQGNLPASDAHVS